MIKQLKEKIYEAQEKSVKVQILTLLPMSWSIKNELKASSYMFRMVSYIRGILSTPNPNHDKIVISWSKISESDEISQVMPRKKDCVSIKVNDARISIQKRLIYFMQWLCSVKQ